MWSDLPWVLAVQSYDGERCLYAALNDETRRVLLEHGFKRQGGSPRCSAPHNPSPKIDKTVCLCSGGWA